MSTFRFRLVTPLETLADIEITSLVLPTADGEIGILKGREHTILDVAEGILRVKDAEGKEVRYACGEGVAEVTESEVTLLTGEGYLAEEAEEGKRARESALIEERKRQEKSALDYKLTRVALMRAFEKLKGKRKE